MSPLPWTPEEDALLRQRGVSGWPEIPGRSRRAVQTRAARLGIRLEEEERRTAFCGEADALWTEQDCAALRHLWLRGDSCAKIGEALGRSPHAVGAQVWRMGLPRRKGQWTQADLDWLSDLYIEGLSWREIADRMGRTVEGVRSKWRAKHGHRREPEREDAP